MNEMTTFPILQFGAGLFPQAHADLFVSEALTRGKAFGRVVVFQTTRRMESKRRSPFVRRFVNHDADRRRFGGLIDLTAANGLNLGQPRLIGALDATNIQGSIVSG